MKTPAIKAIVFMKAHSARVPRKNLRPFCGRPLCDWILNALELSRYVEQILVNTDSDEIAQQASTFQKVNIHVRPLYLRGDHVGASPLIEYDLQMSEGEYYMQTHSTNPLLRSATVDRAIEAFFGQNKHDALFSVTEIRKRFYWPDGRPINHDPKILLRTQDLHPVLEENSCLYIFSRRAFCSTKLRIGSNPLMFPISSVEAVDIDEEQDFEMAEALMKSLLKGRKNGDCSSGPANWGGASV